MLLNQELRMGGHKTVQAGYVKNIYQILGLYKLKKATQRHDDILVFAILRFVARVLREML